MSMFRGGRKPDEDIRSMAGNWEPVKMLVSGRSRFSEKAYGENTLEEE